MADAVFCQIITLYAGFSLILVEDVIAVNYKLKPDKIRISGSGVKKYAENPDLPKWNGYANTKYSK